MRDWFRLSSASGTGLDKIIFGIGSSPHHLPSPERGPTGPRTCYDTRPPACSQFSIHTAMVLPASRHFHFPQCREAHTLGFGRVFRKLRKAQTRPGRFLFPPRIQAIFELPGFRDREEMWQLLCDLGSNTSVRFEAEKKIRTNVYDLAALCSLRKKSMCLPVHLQMSACKAIDSALRFKGFEPPRMAAPLTIPFLSGPKLRPVMRQVLRLFLSHSPGLFLPFYVPKTTLVFAKNPKVFELLHTHKRALRTWASGDKPTCLCREMQQLFKVTPEFGGHCAVSGQEAVRAFPGTAAKMLSGSTNSAVFPRKEKAAEVFEKGIRRWLFRHNISQNVTGVLRVLKHLWQHHEQFKLNRFDYGKISSIHKMTSGMIWHCEDHHPNRAMVYCPALYHDMLTKTFLASDIFQEVSQGVANLLHDQREDAQKRFRKTYPWAFRATIQTPYAFALPKRKKDFLSGRPIISFVKAFMRPLLEATARLVFQLTAVAFPESFASGDVYDLLARFEICKTLRALSTFKTWAAEIKIYPASSRVCLVINFLLLGSFCCSGTMTNRVPNTTPPLRWIFGKHSKFCAYSGVFGDVAPNNRLVCG